jgi:hypothetical protein
MRGRRRAPSNMSRGTAPAMACTYESDELRRSVLLTGCNALGMSVKRVCPSRRPPRRAASSPCPRGWREPVRSPAALRRGGRATGRVADHHVPPRSDRPVRRSDRWAGCVGGRGVARRSRARPRTGSRDNSNTAATGFAGLLARRLYSCPGPCVNREGVWVPPGPSVGSARGVHLLWFRVEAQ